MSRRASVSCERGTVSLFIVIFTTLLITIVTVSFIQLMTKDQQLATVSDLSESASDSAHAGVEDAKRLLLLNQACQLGTAAPSVDCTAIANLLSVGTTPCDTLSQSGLVAATAGEVLLQQNASDGSVKLDQAYTCVRISVNTDDYEGRMAVGESAVVPLKAAGTFKKLQISWFDRRDISSTNSTAIGFPSAAGSVSLPRLGSRWQFNYPALMRTQLVQAGNTFTLADFDGTTGGTGSNANTLFLYPSNIGPDTKDFAIDGRYSPLNAPQAVRCRTTIADGGYACTTTITLPDPHNAPASERQAYLRLSALYNPAHYRIQLLDSAGNVVKFAGVQPLVDSTGRANDVFRRSVARVELRSDVTYPSAAVDIDGNLCKNFSITTKEADYAPTSTCTP